MGRKKGTNVVFIALQSKSGAPLAPPELRSRLVADVEREGTNIIDVAVQILAKKYRVEVPRSNRRTSPAPDKNFLKLNVPVNLASRLAAASQRTGRTPNQEALRVLSDYYGLSMPSKQQETVAV